MPRMILPIVAASCALLAMACSATAPSSSSPSTPETAAAHPLQADKLTDVMRGFDSAVRANVPEEIDEHDRWEGVYLAVADAAAALQNSARQLAGHPPKGLEIPDRGRFAVLAQDLGAAAARLEEAAARSDADAVAIARTQVGNACRNCHERFRPDSPGVPEAFR